MTTRQEKRWQAELEIVKELGEIPSCRRMQKELKERYGIEVNHSIINGDLKKDLETLSKQDYNNQKNGILKMLDDEIDIAHTIATSDSAEDKLKLKAMGTVSKLSKVKADILIKFKQEQAKTIKSEAPDINVYIGKPEQIDVSKFKKLGEKDDEVKDED